MPERIGIRAVWDNKNFVRGQKAYTAGLKKATKTTAAAVTQTNAMTKATMAMMTAMRALGPIIGIYGVAMMAQAAIGLAKMGAQAQRMETAFHSMAKRMGGDADAILKSLRKASQGTIADMELMTAANMAMAGGLSANAELLGDLMEVAAFKAREAGITTEHAWDSLTKGIARRQKLILDNLFIYNIKMDETRSTADIMAQIIREGQKDIAAAGGMAEDAATKFEKWDAKMLNLKRTLGLIISDLDIIGKPIDMTIKGIEDFERLAGYVKEIREFMEVGPGAGPDILGNLGKAISLLQKVGRPGPFPGFYLLMESAMKGISQLGKVTRIEERIGKAGASILRGLRPPGPVPGAAFGLRGAPYGEARGGSTVIQNMVARMKELGKQRAAANVVADITRRLEAFKIVMERQVKLQEDSYNLFVSQARAREQFQRSEREAMVDYQHAVQQVIRDFHEAERAAEQAYYQQRTAAVARYNLATQRAEEDHQRRMARMRQRYDMTQEDNIRARDAIAYLRERRNYNVERKNAETDYSVAAKRRSEDFALQLKQMEEAYQRQQKQREDDYRRTLSEMRTAHARQRRLRLEAFNRQQRDEYNNFVEQERIARGYYDRAGAAWSTFLAGIVSSVNALAFPTGVPAAAGVGGRGRMDVNLTLGGGGTFDAGLKQEILSTVRDVVGRALG